MGNGFKPASSVPDDREDVLEKYKFDQGKPGDDLRKALESVSAALAEGQFYTLGKPFQIILTEPLSDEESGLYGEACKKQREIK